MLLMVKTRNLKLIIFNTKIIKISIISLIKINWLRPIINMVPFTISGIATNTELGRTSVTENVARPDVAKAYPDVVNAKDSGYQVFGINHLGVSFRYIGTDRRLYFYPSNFMTSGAVI
mgnify:CR=1 FL=1